MRLIALISEVIPNEEKATVGNCCLTNNWRSAFVEHDWNEPFSLNFIIVLATSVKPFPRTGLKIYSHGIRPLRKWTEGKLLPKTVFGPTQKQGVPSNPVPPKTDGVFTEMGCLLTDGFRDWSF